MLSKYIRSIVRMIKFGLPVLPDKTGKYQGIGDFERKWTVLNREDQANNRPEQAKYQAKIGRAEFQTKT